VLDVTVAILMFAAGARRTRNSATMHVNVVKPRLSPYVQERTAEQKKLAASARITRNVAMAMVSAVANPVQLVFRFVILATHHHRNIYQSTILF